MTLVSTVGGASGPLFGTLFLRVGAVPRRHRRGLVDRVRQRVAGWPRRGRRSRQGGGRGQDHVRRACSGGRRAWRPRSPTVWTRPTRSSWRIGRGGRPRRDHPMLARKGRASYLGERSVGHQDPGATTVALLMAAAGAADAHALDGGPWHRNAPRRHRRRLAQPALARAAVALAVGDAARPPGTDRGGRGPGRGDARHRRRSHQGGDPGGGRSGGRRRAHGSRAARCSAPSSPSIFSTTRSA